jgi:hypothetical protein
MFTTACHPRAYVTFCNVLVFYSEKLFVPHPTPKLEDHPLLAVHDCLFNIFTAILHIWRSIPDKHIQNWRRKGGYEGKTKGLVYTSTLAVITYRSGEENGRERTD